MHFIFGSLGYQSYHHENKYWGCLNISTSDSLFQGIPNWILVYCMFPYAWTNITNPVSRSSLKCLPLLLMQMWNASNSVEIGTNRCKVLTDHHFLLLDMDGLVDFWETHPANGFMTSCVWVTLVLWGPQKFPNIDPVFSYVLQLLRLIISMYLWFKSTYCYMFLL